MKIIAIGAVTAGGKTTLVNAIKDKLTRTASLHFDDYSFDGEVNDFYKWVSDGANYNVWDLSPLKADIEKIINSDRYDYLLLDYPFAYQNKMIKDYLDCCIFIDTPLDIALARKVLRDMKESSADDIRYEMDVYLKYARIAYVQMLQDILPISDYVIDGTKELKIIINEAINYIKKNRFNWDRDIVNEMKDEKDVFEIEDNKIELKQALNKLTDKERAVIVLRYFEEMSLNDVAYILGENLSTVKSRIYRALEKLKEYMIVK